MPSPTAQAHKQVTSIIVAALVGALFIYIGLTYVIPARPVEVQPSTQLLITILSVVAVITALVGLVMERLKLDQAQRPGEVQAAVIISCALGESPAIYGLLVYFMSSQRNWLFFGISILYFFLLFLRMPTILQRMDELESKS